MLPNGYINKSYYPIFLDFNTIGFLEGKEDIL